MSKHPDDDDPGKENARSTDDDTSKDAAEHKFRSGEARAQAIRCLVALRALGEATRSEIDVYMCCVDHPVFWRRSSDLLKWSLIAKTGERRQGKHRGSKSQGVLRITRHGEKFLEAIGL
jgi:hypothetical protein